MKTFLFRMSRLVPLIFLILMGSKTIMFVNSYIDNFSKKNDDYLFIQFTLGLTIDIIVSIFIVILINWVTFGSFSLWINKKTYSDNILNKSNSKYRISRTLSIFCMFMLLLYFILLILHYIESNELVFNRQIAPNLPLITYLMMSSTILLFNWLYFRKTSLWIHNPILNIKDGKTQ